MRSDQVHRALAQNLNRYEICQLASKGVRATHKLGSRFEDTINNALEYLGKRQPGPQSILPRPERVATKSMNPAV